VCASIKVNVYTIFFACTCGHFMTQLQEDEGPSEELLQLVHQLRFKRSLLSPTLAVSKNLG
jgi:hypothetical protein